MKKVYIFAIVLIISGLSVALALVSLKPRDLSASLVKTAPQPIETDQLSFRDSMKLGGSACLITIEVDYPKSGNALVVGSIQEWISEMLGGTYAGRLSDAKGLLAFYAQDAKADFKSQEAALSPMDVTFLNERRFRKVYETDKYVTYEYVGNTYMGGAHGSHIRYSQTFRKLDGRRLDWNMFQSNNLEAVRILVEQNLMEQYFKGDTKENLEMIKYFTDGYTPLPQANPALVEDGVMFVYQEYEIAPYAWGQPSCIISYSALDSLLSVTGKSLLRHEAMADKN